MADGWHLEQMPLGHGGWSLHPALILQLMSSKLTNFPCGEDDIGKVNKKIDLK